MAFVFIQHLAPGHPSLLVELLLRSSKMPVREVKDGDLVKPNQVYIIPPNAGLTISGDVFHVTSRKGARGVPMPIDGFLFSLAKERRHRSIGVILSGNASDGTLGLKAIKAEGGVTFAQDVESAKFQGMPRSAIDSGSVDFVLTLREIAEKITKMARSPLTAATIRKQQISRSSKSGATPEGLQDVFSIIKRTTGVDFSLYKPGTILRRIQRRLGFHRVTTLREYLEILRGNPKESKQLMEDFLIHVTSFFRDPSVFQSLKENVFPRILKNKTLQKPCRIWVPGCSAGEEAYSIAMGLVEALGRKGRRAKKLPVKIFATDISDLSIERARKGVFKTNEVSGVSRDRLRRFFTKTKDGYEINNEIHSLCVFGKHDLIREPPFANMDLISCRNLFIYLGPNVQEKIVPFLHHALHPNGFLLLGKEEAVGPFPHLFELVDKRTKLYVKKTSGMGKAVEETNKEKNKEKHVFRVQAGGEKRLDGGVHDDQLRKALEATKKTIDDVIMRFEVTNEELQATNEELNATNEEMQSTNEELVTTQEELQSTNEELTTLNEELQNRNLEVTLAKEFADNIVETIREPLLILDSELKVVRANLSFYESFKLTALETEKKHIYSLAKGQWDIPRLRILLEKIIPRKKEISNFEIEHDFPVIGYRTLLLNARQISRHGPQNQGKDAPMILVAIDLLTMENRVTKKIVEFSEGEKQRVGKDLHDGLGQNMTGIALLSRSLEKRLAGKGAEVSKESHDAAKITQLVKQGIFEISRLARGLTPIALENIGIIPALAEAAEQVKALFGVNCAFECKEVTITSNPQYKINLYYIAQEAINNAIRHGKAKRIKVQLKRHMMKKGEEIVLSISDDGLGLPKNFTQKEGMGLRIMRYRASDIGGTLEIRQGARRGTVITARCPLVE